MPLELVYESDDEFDVIARYEFAAYERLPCRLKSSCSLIRTVLGLLYMDCIL